MIVPPNEVGLLRQSCPTTDGGILPPLFLQCIQQIVYTSRQINTIPEHPMQIFNAVLICDVDEIDFTRSSMQKCYENVDLAYWYDASTPTTGRQLYDLIFINS